MSKYKVGDKVVLMVTGTDETRLLPRYVLNDNFNLWEQSIDELAEPLSTYIEQARAEGQNKAWELAKKIVLPQSQGGMNDEDYRGTFGSGITEKYIMKNLTYLEAAAKVKASEKAKEEIKVGDIVRLHEGSDNDLCILCKTSDEKYYNAVDKYGALYPLLRKEHFSKTGRHIDIDSFLKQIGGEQK